MADYIPRDARIVRLANDMKTLDSEIVEIKAPYHFEANELNYLNGTWIYTYNTNWKNRMCMAPQGYRQAEPVLHELHDESHATGGQTA